MHYHIGLAEGVKVFGYVIVFGFLWRLATLILNDKGMKRLAAALGFIY